MKEKSSVWNLSISLLGYGTEIFLARKRENLAQ